MNAVQFIPHVLDTEDISPDLDLITYLINDDKKHFAVARAGTIRPGNPCIVVSKDRVPKNDGRFQFAESSAFDPAVALADLREVSEFLAETYIPVNLINFEILVFGRE